jgi:hypothetical protein
MKTILITRSLFCTILFSISLDTQARAPSSAPLGETTESNSEAHATGEYQKNIGVTQTGITAIDDLNCHRINLGQFNNFQPDYFSQNPENNWSDATRTDVSLMATTNPPVNTSKPSIATPDENTDVVPKNKDDNQ